MQWEVTEQLSSSSISKTPIEHYLWFSPLKLARSVPYLPAHIMLPPRGIEVGIPINLNTMSFSYVAYRIKNGAHRTFSHAPPLRALFVLRSV